ncbi:MAG: 6,7-dimethyl-8-ribityllumazine synthase [Bdellovibrionaceae bacterium]|nr:6,7-dimethyl-8-ribityllumazine synthase [Pseudobdellovibrionaceae bacterium]
MKRTAKQKQSEARSQSGLQGSLDGKALKIGVVCARFNRDITAKLEAGAMRRLKELGVADKNIRLVSVPGAVEIPLGAKALLKAGMDGVITLGCVIRGETTHYESVCTSVERGCTHLQLEQLKPVVFGVLTVENMEQALDRVGGHHGHKGEEAAEVAVEMCNLLKVIKKRK